MDKLLLLVAAAVGAGALLYLFMRWERAGCEHWVVYLLLAVIVVDSTVYANQTNEPRGLLHPGTGSLEFRLPEVIITLALVARLVTKQRPLRAGIPALLWTSVAAWWTVEAVEGVIRHNSMVKLPYEAKAIVYVAGGFALLSGIPVRRFIEGRGIERLVRWSAVAATVLLLTAFSHHTYSFNIPLMPLVGFGQMGTDAATAFVIIGTIGLMLELAKEQRNRLTLLCIIPLALSPFGADQRAVLLQIGATVTVLVIVALGSTARQRLRVKASEVSLVAFATVGVVLAVSVVPAVTQGHSVTAPLTSTYQRTVSSVINSEAKVQSAQDRINEWNIAVSDAKQNIFLGQGLGFTYTYFDVGSNAYVTTDLTHNFTLDLWLRTGIIGVLLFLVALVVSLVQGFTTWHLHPDRMVAVLALALCAVVIGLVAKGQVESVLDNYRLASLLGISLGMLRAAVTSAGGGVRDLRTQRDLLHYETAGTAL